jgi:uncharacterized protein
LIRAILDTGPLVALLNRRDVHHSWAQHMFQGVVSPVKTCESVISETCFLLRSIPRGPETVFELIEQGLIVVPFRLSEDSDSIQKLLKKYANVPISIADACLIRMAEKDSRATILTVDSDFRHYRKNGRDVIPVLMP